MDADASPGDLRRFKPDWKPDCKQEESMKRACEYLRQFCGYMPDMPEDHPDGRHALLSRAAQKIALSLVRVADEPE